MKIGFTAKVMGQFLALSLIFSAIAFGQATSQISGSTRDASGASVPGVEVSATQTDTNAKRTVVTDDSGNFVLTNLPTGPYRLEATKAGFQTYVQNGIQLQVDASPTIPITMNVGQVNQTVEVSANVVQVETEKLGVSDVMETQRILELPLNGRNPTDLIALTPGAVQTGSSPSYGMNTGVQIAVAGGQSFGVYYALDGAPHMNLYDATNMPLPFPDALQEFKVDASTQNSSSGTHSGAQVNAVTKSGTNSFHGDAFEFFRNGDLNARNFFSPKQDNLKRNQFGGVVGGPIKKNKFFIFGGFQATELRQSPAPSTEFVPTPAMEAGDFSVFASAACQGTDKALKAPFTTINGKANQLPASSISPVALKISSYFPAATNGCGLVLTSNPISQYYWQVPVRGDYVLTDKQTIFGRYLFTKQNTALPYALEPNDILATATTGGVAQNSTNDWAQDAALGHTWLISATAVNSFRVAMNRIVMYHIGGKFFGPQDVGIDAYSPIKAIQLTITGGPSIGTGTSEDNYDHITYLSVNDDFNLIRGKHQLTFGGDMMHSVVDRYANTRSLGNYAVNGQTTGLGLADFMAGILSQDRQSAPNENQTHQVFEGLYAQDTWKATSRLTLNIGIRWEPFFPLQENDSRAYTFSVARFDANTVSKIWTNAPPGFYYPGDPGFNGKAGSDSHLLNFEPRIGIAYDPFGDGKTSIRVGAGTSYEFVNQQYYTNENNVAPFAGDTTVNGPIPLANPWSTTPGGNPFPYVSIPPNGFFPSGSVYLPIPANLKTTQIYSWNVSLQRQLTSKIFASASYIGNHTIHLWDNIEQNPAVYIPGNCVAGQYGLTAAGPCSNTANVNSRRVLYLQNPVAAAGFSQLTAADDGATSKYHAMLLASTYRVNSNVNVIGNYTWSHCISDYGVSNGSANSNPGTNYVHVNDRALDAGNCVQDRRNVFNLTVVARTPTFSGRALKLVATGWSLSTLYRYSSGAPLYISSGLDQQLSANTTERPNQVLSNTAAPAGQGSPCATQTPCVNWLNAAAFSQPALGTLGNMGAYNVLGPHFWQLDMSLVREFRVREGENLQFRFEAFNILNGVRFNNPGVALNAPSTFGVITSAQDPRILQLAMKFVF